MLRGEFCFNNIGQGLFYSGKITCDDNKSDCYVVYDCGTLDGLDDHFKSVLKSALPHQNSHLALLMISHFDADHVNGIPFLLKRVSRIDTIIMPYLTIEERALIASMSDVKDDENYLRFIADPVGFFEESSVRIGRIILLTHSADELNNDIPPFSDDSPKDYFDKLKHLKDKEVNPSKDLYTIDNKTTNVHICYDTFKCEICGGWCFKFYVNELTNKKEKNKKMDAFLREMEKIIEEVNPKKDAKRLINAIVGDIDVLHRVQDIYKKHISSDMNNTSLVALHYPDTSNFDNIGYTIGVFPEYTQMLCHCILPDCRFCNPCYSDNGSDFVTLLSGDINFNKDLDGIRNRFGDNLLSKAAVALVPHHGAVNSWSEEALDIIGNRFIRWVVSSGVNSRFGHPHNEVITSLLRQHARFLWCNNHQKVLVSAVANMGDNNKGFVIRSESK